MRHSTPRPIALAAAVVIAGLVATSTNGHYWIVAQSPASGAQASDPIHPALFKNVYYKPLTVFSRGGRVTAVAGVASNPQLYYMGSPGGVWKTTDAGATWVPITDGQIKVGSIGAIAVAD